jgi:hypothetical protein
MAIPGRFRRLRLDVPGAHLTRAADLELRQEWSPGIKLGVPLLRGYLVVSVVLLAVKAVQLGGG